jgi:hypothetical protein
LWLSSKKPYCLKEIFPLDAEYDDSFPAAQASYLSRFSACGGVWPSGREIFFPFQAAAEPGRKKAAPGKGAATEELGLNRG